MPLKPVHEKEIDRASGRQVLTRINPTRTFLFAAQSGMAGYTCQNGQWFGISGNEMNPEDVPQEFRSAIADNPVRVVQKGPAVTETCQFCGESMNASAMKDHYVSHVRNTLEHTGETKKRASA